MYIFNKVYIQSANGGQEELGLRGSRDIFKKFLAEGSFVRDRGTELSRKNQALHVATSTQQLSVRMNLERRGIEL